MTSQRLGQAAVLLLFAGALLDPTVAQAGGWGGSAASDQWQVLPVAEIARHQTPPLDRVALAVEDEERLLSGQPYRFAVPQLVNITPDEAGTWETLPTGERLWRLRISCPLASSLNLGFTRFDLDPGARLLVYAANGTGPVMQFTAADNRSHGQLWTPVLLTDDLVLELVTADRSTGADQLVLGSIGRGYRSIMADDLEKSGSCNIDVVCSEADDWQEEVAAVARITVSGLYLCTGTLINNTAQDGKPYFLTALHCNVSANSASTIVVYWNFESPTCGQLGGGSMADFQEGSYFRASHSASDFALVELDDDLNPAFGVKFAGWNRADTDPASAVCIHHPSGDEKAISFEDDPLTTTSYLLSSIPGDGNFLRVADWDLGTTEPGSSGASLFDSAHRVVGQLRGGYAACDNDLSDWHGRLFVSWTGGGSSDSRLSDWLDPLGTGQLFLDILDPENIGLVVEPLAGLSGEGKVGGPFLPSGITYTLENKGTEPIDFSVTSDAAWVTVTDGTGTLAGQTSTTVSVSFNAEAEGLPVGQYEGALSFVNLTDGVGDVDLPLQLSVKVGDGSRDPRIQEVAPNPASSYVVVRYYLGRDLDVKARVLNLHGRVIWEQEVEGQAGGDNQIAWDTQGLDGRPHGSGVYFFHLETSGGEDTAKFVILR